MDYAQQRLLSLCAQRRWKVFDPECCVMGYSEGVRTLRTRRRGDPIKDPTVRTALVLTGGLPNPLGIPHPPPTAQIFCSPLVSRPTVHICPQGPNHPNLQHSPTERPPPCPLGCGPSLQPACVPGPDPPERAVMRSEWWGWGTGTPGSEGPDADGMAKTECTREREPQAAKPGCLVLHRADADARHHGTC